MKYELTSTVKNGLHQIKALRDIPRFGVKKGDLGGWVEAEKNLSQEDDAWVYGDAEVSGNAWVYGDAKVSGNARVYGDAKVSGNAKVYGDARVSGNARVYGDAEVFGNAKVSDNAFSPVAQGTTNEQSRRVDIKELLKDPTQKRLLLQGAIDFIKQVLESERDVGPTQKRRVRKKF